MDYGTSLVSFLAGPARLGAPTSRACPVYLHCSSISAMRRRQASRLRLSRAEARVLEQFWKLGTCSVREILDSLPPDEQVAYTTVQTLVYRLEGKGAVRKVKRIGNAQLFEPAISQGDFPSGL